MAGTIRTCSAWTSRHGRPRYTLRDACPDCGATTTPAAPARFDPADPYGSYRRATVERHED